MLACRRRTWTSNWWTSPESQDTSNGIVVNMTFHPPSTGSNDVHSFLPQQQPGCSILSPSLWKGNAGIRICCNSGGWLALRVLCSSLTTYMHFFWFPSQSCLVCANKRQEEYDNEIPDDESDALPMETDTCNSSSLDQQHHERGLYDLLPTIQETPGLPE